jgi:DNA-binding NtrC family response regulator
MSFPVNARKDFFMEAYISAETRPERLFFIQPNQGNETQNPPQEHYEPATLSSQEALDKFSSLSDEQIIAIGLFAKQFTTNQAARMLGLTRGTFRSKVYVPALRSLEVRDKQEAIELAFEAGILNANRTEDQ